MALRIVFMGTPDFAVPSLRILLENGYEIAAVVTATDKLGGRGNKQLLESPVKRFAIEHNIPVLQPTLLKSESFLSELRQLHADLQVVVAFRMLPEVVWRMPRLGTFNLHGSLLPKYRGAAPINWAIINGEKETGVTTFFIQQEIDTGDLLFQASLPIGENDTAGEIHDKMMELGADLVLTTVQAIESGHYELKKQNDALACPAPKIFHETCEINFNQPVGQVHNFVRGLSPYPTAWTMFNGLEMKLFRTSIDYNTPLEAPGTWVSDRKKTFKFAAQNGYLMVHELQIQGKKRMPVADFLNGWKEQ